MAEASKKHVGIRKRIRDLEMRIQTTGNLRPGEEQEMRAQIETLKNKLENTQPFNMTCSRCGKESTMPFPPRKKKENFCKSCYWIIHNEKNS